MIALILGVMYTHDGDLKNYEAPRFYLFTPEQAGYLLVGVVALGLVLERIGLL